MINASKQMDRMRNPGLNLDLMSPIDLQEGVARLSRGAYFKEAPLEMTLSILTESAAQMSGVERVSIWALTEHQRELRCLDLYQLSTRRHSSGDCLSANEYPAYFRALREEGCIVADNAALHPSTSEFARGYLGQHQITAMLDTPIHIRGDLEGVLCIEQVATRVPWTTTHRLFAHAVANLVTLALVEYEADEARRQVRSANERLRAVFDSSRDALLLADGDSGVILDANTKAEALFATSRLQLVGKHQRQLHPSAEGANVFRNTIEGNLPPFVRTEIQCFDGAIKDVEITTEVAEIGDGKRLALGIFRPI